MGKLKQKSYLITNIPAGDWKRFKRWAAIEEFDNLNHAFATFIRNAGRNTLTFTGDGANSGTETT